MKLGSFLNAVLVFLALLSFGVALLAGTKLSVSFGDFKATLFFIALPTLTGVLSLWSLRLSQNTRSTLVICIISIGVSVVGVETYIVASKIDAATYVKEAAKYWGVKYDGRTKLEVIEKLEETTKIHTYPTIPINAFMEWENAYEQRSSLILDGKELVPLAAIPNAQTVYCNEMGYWVTYNSDEYGFRNPPHIWHKTPVQIAIIGDSFAHGSCVRDEDHFVAKIRARYPKTLNLAASSAGPLYELAILNEYGPHIKPKLVLWFFFEGNDTINLLNERTYTKLMSYLGQGYSQKLFLRAEEIGQIVKKKVAAIRVSKKAEVDYKKPSRLQSLLKVFLLRNIRKLIGIRGFFSSSYDRLSPQDQGLTRLEILRRDETLLNKIFAKAQKLTQSWNGDLVVVYLPAWRRGRYIETGPTPYYDEVRKITGRVMKTQNIKFIDLIPYFESHKKPESLNAHQRRNSGHYSPVGYDLIGGVILQHIPQWLHRK